MWKYLIRCLRRGLALKQISGKGKGQLLHGSYMGVAVFLFCWKLLFDAAESFRFLFFQLFPPEDVLWMPPCIVLALSQMILIISWLLGKNCGLVESQFPIFHRWFEWLFIDPNPLITLYEKRNKVCSGEHIFCSLVKFFQPF